MSESTLYPKIRTKLKEIIHDLQLIHEFASECPPPTKLMVTGTVKLHGTHADILIYPDNTIVLQSRNCLNLSITADNHEFAASMATKTAALLSLRDRYYERSKRLFPKVVIDEHAPLILAGEWIGQNIQKGVALVHLSKRFVIVSASLNGGWEPDLLYAGLESEADGIYNISRAGFYHAAIDLADPEATEQRLQGIAEEIAAECPFAKTFGVKGAGEGVVWKFDSFPHRERVWFKTKGGPFKPNYAPRPTKGPPSDKVLDEQSAQQKTAVDCAKAWCSEGRLEQAWDYLRETGKERNIKGLGLFLKWIVEDILVEERWDMEQLGVQPGLLKKAIADIAKPWYIGKSGIYAS
ncbi:uncharacterized protein BDZ99DRAFT_458733 [Mytilinidion resinicola]|uniref:RNA ligase domain-containing protein n=1 Tax=Mytilinidion resinicola TaxID=574789 RepID=A0A6A6Z0W7_9PEZI|nr:uncharacterized protein BDZ99DRAFT_458733 [Mytilinidion resinicola]KAF2814741.1 hypothetical protein BDZ99DRAFT_458733 [Mytilinidion resinicola]